jgi:hypothetical protein
MCVLKLDVPTSACFLLIIKHSTTHDRRRCGHPPSRLLPLCPPRVTPFGMHPHMPRPGLGRTRDQPGTVLETSRGYARSVVFSSRRYARSSSYACSTWNAVRERSIRVACALLSGERQIPSIFRSLSAGVACSHLLFRDTTCLAPTYVVPARGGPALGCARASHSAEDATRSGLNS